MPCRPSVSIRKNPTLCRFKAIVTNQTEVLVPDIGGFKDVSVIDVLVKDGQQIEKETPLITIDPSATSGTGASTGRETNIGGRSLRRSGIRRARRRGTQRHCLQRSRCAGCVGTVSGRAHRRSDRRSGVLESLCQPFGT